MSWKREPQDEEQIWQDVKSLLGSDSMQLGPYLSYQVRHSPKRLLFSLSYYKFTSKMIGCGKCVLDVGCGEGLGTWLLATECGFAQGVDPDPNSINAARRNWPPEKYPQVRFACGNFLKMPRESFDAVVLIDVIEHILPRNVPTLLARVTDCLCPDGIVVIGTPNRTAQKYASTVSRAGHVNMYDHTRIQKTLTGFFGNVFLFGANDEVVHTGFWPMCNYIIALCSHPRRSVL